MCERESERVRVRVRVRERDYYRSLKKGVSFASINKQDALGT